MKVKFLRLGRSAHSIEFDGEARVNDVLEKADFERMGHAVSLNGISTDLDASVADGDVIVATPKVQGG